LRRGRRSGHARIVVKLALASIGKRRQGAVATSFEPAGQTFGGVSKWTNG
jgi:hypothetical protein